MSLSLGYNVLVDRSTPPGWQHLLRQRRWSSRGIWVFMGRSGLTIEDPAWKVPFWETSVLVPQNTQHCSLVTKRAVHSVACSVINNNSDCFWRRQNWFVNCDCAKSSQNCICRLLSLTTTIWRGCLALIISVSSALLSSVSTIQSFSRQSLTLLDDSDITASWGNDDWTATPTLTSLLPTILSKLEDVTYSLTADDMTSSTTDSPSMMTEDVTPSLTSMDPKRTWLCIPLNRCRDYETSARPNYTIVLLQLSTCMRGSVMASQSHYYTGGSLNSKR